MNKKEEEEKEKNKVSRLATLIKHGEQWNQSKKVLRAETLFVFVLFIA